MIKSVDLETQRLVLSEVSLFDEKDIFEYASETKVTKHLMWNAHKNLNDTRGYIEYCLRKSDDGDLITWGIREKSTEKLIGTVDASEKEGNVVEVGYVVSNKYWGKGYATEATMCVIKYINKVYPERELVAITFEGNEASSRVLEKCGFMFDSYIEDYFEVNGVTVKGARFVYNKDKVRI